MENTVDYKTRQSAAQKVTLVGAIVNLFLGIFKVFFGVIGHSQALIADGIHSIGDLITDALVYVAAKYGGQRVDTDHPYGHGRIETAATMFLALVLILTGLGIAYDAIHEMLYQPSFIKPSVFVLIIAFLSIVAKELLYHYTKHIATKIDSALLHANAWHHRSDAASSIVVLIGVGGALLGIPHLDGLAAIIVALMIVKMGWELGWSSIRELVDTAVDEETLKKIKGIICQTPGVVTLHQLRTRSMGGKIFADVHVIVKPKLSVSEGHHISQLVHFALLKKVENVIDVTVHIDPEDDEVSNPSLDLPPREQLKPQLMQAWKALPGVEKINHVNLHYLDGKLSIEVFLSQEDMNSEKANDLSQRYFNAVKHIANIESVRVLLF